MKLPEGVTTSPDGSTVQRIEVTFSGRGSGEAWAVLPLSDMARYQRIAQVVGMVAFRLNGLRGVTLDAPAVGQGLLNAWVGDEGVEVSGVLEAMGSPLVAPEGPATP